jgi:RNA polymerase sigma-70 factor, ECF subfamily
MEAVIRSADRVTAEDGAEALAIQARTDPPAFGALYELHCDAVFRYLRARTSSEDLALELSAITFERAFKAIPRYRTRGGGILAWLFRIARNAAADEARRGRRRGAMSGETPSDVSSPEHLVVRAERRTELLQRVAGLPEVQRDALALRYGASLTAREIAAVLGKSEAATQKLISRALARLREDLDEA